MRSVVLQFLFMLLVVAPALAKETTLNYEDYVQTREKFWDWADNKVKKGDKVICEEEFRTNMGTCVRAYVMAQKINSASEVLRVQKLISSAALIDAKSNAMDEATVLIYSLESLLKFRENMVYENPLIKEDPSIWDREWKLFSQAFSYLSKKTRDDLSEINRLRRKYPASAETEGWRQSKVDYIDEHYSSILIAPGSDPKAINSKSVAADMRKERKAKNTEKAKLLMRDNAWVFACVKVPNKQIVNDLSVAIEPCVAINSESITQECNQQKMSRLKSAYLQRMPASEKKAVKKCDRKRASKKKPTKKS